MDIVVKPTPADVGIAVADLLEPTIRAKGVLGLATGSTPNPTYTELVRRHTEDGLSFAGCKAFLLDEYYGLPKSHPESYYATIRRELTHHVDISDADVHSLDGAARDPQAAAAAYERAIAAAGGVDHQILGIGVNGHIAFNEPGSPLDSRTRVIDLHPQTIADNARFFDSEDEVPRRALTQGIGTILEAKRIVLIATGENKAEAVRAFTQGPVTEDCPASALQRHGAVTVILDEAAASKLA